MKPIKAWVLVTPKGKVVMDWENTPLVFRSKANAINSEYGSWADKPLKVIITEAPK